MLGLKEELWYKISIVQDVYYEVYESQNVLIAIICMMITCIHCAHLTVLILFECKNEVWTKAGKCLKD